MFLQMLFEPTLSYFVAVQGPFRQMPTHDATMYSGSETLALHVVKKQHVFAYTRRQAETDSSLKDPSFDQRAAEPSEDPAMKDLALNCLARQVPDFHIVVHVTADKPVAIIVPSDYALGHVDVKALEPKKRVLGHLHVSLDQPKIIPAFTDAFIDKQVAPVHNSEPALDARGRSHTNLVVHALESSLNMAEYILSVTAKTIIIRQAGYAH